MDEQNQNTGVESTEKVEETSAEAVVDASNEAADTASVE